MVAVVQSDAEKFRHHADGSPDARRALNQRQCLKIERPDTVQALASERGSGDVRDHAREVADRAFLIENSGLFLPNRAVAKKLHPIAPQLLFCMLHTRP